jgi:putative ABC transport system permease protein
MTGIAAHLAAQYADDKGETVSVEPLAEVIVGDLVRPLYILLGASLFVLLIACANLSNLLLARGIARSREIAVRAALGAARARITRQLLTESLLLAVIGSTGGILIARGAVAALVRLGPDVFRVRPPSVNVTVLGVAIALAGMTTLLFGLVPALRMAPTDPQAALRSAGTRATGGRTARTRTTLAVVQLALAVVLLSASTLVMKSFARILSVKPGVRGDHLLTMNLTLPGARYDSVNSTLFYNSLITRLGAVPGVTNVATTSLVPFSGDFDRVGITRIAGQPDRVGAAAASGDRYVVSPSYFETMGVRLIRGRLLTSADRIDGPVVCVVDEVFAKKVFADLDPLGQSMKIPGRPEFARIVGVVTHVKTYGLDVESPGQIYLTNEQYPWRWSSLVVRTIGDPLSMTASVTRVVHELDPLQPVSGVATMEDRMSDLLRARRFTVSLLSVFAAVAMTLAAIGLYGVIAYGVTQRRREFGVRMALGAQRAQIARMILFEGGRIAVVGAVIGVAGALVMSRLIASMLFEVSARDSSVFGLTTAGMICVALLACMLPALRATTTDAAEVLRGD